MSFEEMPRPERPPLTEREVADLSQELRDRLGNDFLRAVFEFERSLLEYIQTEVSCDTAGARALLLQSGYWRAVRPALDPELAREPFQYLTTDDQRILDEVNTQIVTFLQSL